MIALVFRLLRAWAIFKVIRSVYRQRRHRSSLGQGR